MSQIEINPELLSTSTNKTILITGAARGIGAATASLFNAHGTNVVIADLEPLRADAEKLITEFTHPERGVFIPANIVDWAQLTACFKSAIARFGGIDIVVANAGIMESKPVLDVSTVDENGDLRESVDAQRVIDVNLKGTLNSKFYPSIYSLIYWDVYMHSNFNLFPMRHLTNPKALRLALFHLQSPTPTPSTPTKSILLVISTSGYFGGTGVSAYCASKHGVLGLLRSSQTAAQNLGVRVNAIAPFFTPTNITAGFARQWSEHGLEKNSPARVAEAIAHVSLDEGRRGDCVMVCLFFSFVLGILDFWLRLTVYG